MRKTFELENLECANCAAKMERDISALPGVQKCTITFMTSRMSLSVAENADMDALLKEAQTIMKSYEKDCVIVK